MPLPLIPLIIGGATVVAGVFGIGKSIKAGIDIKKANSTNKDANSIIKNAKWRLNTSRLSSRDAIEKLGTQKLVILDKGINRFVKSFEQLRNIEIENSLLGCKNSISLRWTSNRLPNLKRWAILQLPS